MKVFSGSSNPQLAEKIAKNLDLQVSPLEITVFPDGEKRVRVLESVLGEHAIVVQPTNPPADTHYMELFFIVDALKRSGAEFVTAVIPYLGYERQDHVFRDGEAVSLEVIAKTLESTGLTNIICVDLHSIKIPDVFTIPVTHISAMSLFAHVIKNTKESVLVSPDMGGIRRIKLLSEMLGNMDYAAIEKDRDLATGAIHAKDFGEGSVKDKKIAFIVDDMISSGKTIASAAEVLKQHGIEKIYVFATHAIFSENAPEILQHASVEKVFVTDSVNIPEIKMFDKLEILSLGSLLAEAI